MSFECQVVLIDEDMEMIVDLESIFEVAGPRSDQVGESKQASRIHLGCGWWHHIKRINLLFPQLDDNNNNNQCSDTESGSTHTETLAGRFRLTLWDCT